MGKLDLPYPMLAERGAPRGNQWCYEMKWDGVRAITQVGHREVHVMSRNGNDITATYPELQELARLAPQDAIVDGEIVAMNAKGVPDFGVLQRRMKLTRKGAINSERKKTPIYYLVFDLLDAGEGSTRNQEYTKRRSQLFGTVSPGENVLLPPAHGSDQKAAFAASKELGLEGVIAKRAGSTYQPGARSRDWLKKKHELHQEVVVIGWRPSQKAGGLASVLVAIPNEEGELRYAGRVGTGFSEQEREEIARTLRAAQRETAPVPDVPVAAARDAKWVRPTQVAEVRYTDRTDSGALRHPAWRGWRPDKSPRELG